MAKPLIGYMLMTLGTTASFEWKHDVYCFDDSDAIERAKMAMEQFATCQWFTGMNVYNQNNERIATLRLEKPTIKVEPRAVPPRAPLDPVIRINKALENNGYYELGIVSASYVKEYKRGEEDGRKEGAVYLCKYRDEDADEGTDTCLVYVWKNDAGQEVADF